MRDLVLSDDPVLVSYVEALLKDAGIVLDIRDRNVSTVYGSLGALPQRIAVDEDRWDEARRILADAGLEAWIVK